MLETLERPKSTIGIITTHQNRIKLEKLDQINDHETQIDLDEYWYLRGLDPFDDEFIEDDDEYEIDTFEQIINDDIQSRLYETMERQRFIESKMYLNI